MARHLELGVPTVSREVNRLADAGILKMQTAGRSRLVNANWELSGADPLAHLLDRTVGPLARLSEVLGELPEIVSAWIYGSWAERYSGTVGTAALTTVSDPGGISLRDSSCGVVEGSGRYPF